MGTILSLNKDYNHVLATQPRASLGIAKLQVQDNFQQQPLVQKLSIPDPVRNSKLKPAPPIQQPIQSEHLAPARDNQTINRSSSFTNQSNYSMYNPTMNNDAMVVARSVSNLNNRSSSFGSNRAIVERNGKQFVTEFKERMERRYVQVFDESMGRTRLFEVTDIIPTKTIRSMNNHRQAQLQNGVLRNTLTPTLPSNQRSTRPPSVNERREVATQSNLLGFKDLNDPDTVARQFDSYQRGAALPTQDNNNNNNTSSTAQSRPQRTTPSRPQLTTQESVDSAYSQPKVDTARPLPPQNVPSQYTSGSYHSQAPSLRPRSPTTSEYSGRTSTRTSESDDSEGVDRTKPPYNRRSDRSDRPPRPTSTRPGNNRNNTAAVAYGTVRDSDSPPPFDPFAKTVRTGDHYYAKRPGVNNYAQPTNNRGYQTGAGGDYTPFPMAHKQAKRTQYAARRESNPYDG